mgnify:CR=1 FL=1
MIIRKFEKNIKFPLEKHEDDRGRIIDIFYNENINHVAVIETKPFNIRGNHYHKKTTQHILITKGYIEYWYKEYGSSKAAEFTIAEKGDIVSTPPFEIHALKILELDNEFIVFSSGLRGGTDYEQDTYRVDNIINEE